MAAKPHAMVPAALGNGTRLVAVSAAAAGTESAEIHGAKSAAEAAEG